MTDKVQEIKIVWKREEIVTEDEYRTRLWKVFRFLLQLSASENNPEPDSPDNPELGEGETQ